VYFHDRSLLEELNGGSVLVDPAGIVGADVFPSWFELVAHGPHEVTLDVAVEDVHDALAEAHDLVAGVEFGVHGAGAVLDSGLVEGKTSLSIWAQSVSSTVEIGAVLLEVSVWALNTLAGLAGWGVGIVKASEPEGANVGGERPLTNPDVVLEVLGVADVGTVFVTVLTDVTVDSTPGEVLMSVHDNVLVVIVSEEIVPGVWVEVEGVMEDELDAGLLLLNHCSHVSVELLEQVKVRAPPWLVDWLNGVDSLVVAPSVEETLDGILGPVDVVLVDSEKAAAVIWVDLTHPFAPGVFPVREVVLILPLSSVADTRVVKSVLGSFDGMDIEQDLDVVLLGGIEEPLNLVLGALSAADVGTVGLEGPVTDWDSDDLNISGSHLHKSVLSDPKIPVLT